MIAKYMGWPWQAVMATPMDVLDVVADLIREEQAEAEKAAQRAKQRR